VGATDKEGIALIEGGLLGPMLIDGSILLVTEGLKDMLG